MFKPTGPLAAGLSLLLFVFATLLSGCGGDDGPLTSEKSKFKPASGSSAQESEEPAATGEADGPPRKVNVKSPPGNGGTAAKGDVPSSPFAGQNEPAGDTTDGDPNDRYALPRGGDTQALLRFIDDLGQREPEGTTRDEVLADAVAIQEARLTAARRVLGSELDERTRTAVIRACMQIHNLLAQMGVKDAKQRYESFIEELVQSDDPALAEQGRLQKFQLSIQTILSNEPLDVDAITAEVKQLVDGEKQSISAFVLATSVCEAMDQMAESAAPLRPALIEILTFLGSAYEKHEEPQVVARAKQHQDLARAWKIDIFGKCDALENGEAEAGEQLVAAVTELVSQPDRIAFTQAQKVAYKLEAELAQHELALQVYDAMAKGLAEHEDKEVGKAAEDMAASARKRIGLIGQPLAVEGVLLDGKPFDPKTLEGKVVLVDFWATWCGPCLREFPNIRRAYLDYHDKGFEVVGISLDSQMIRLEQFFSRMELPWFVVVSQDLYDKKVLETENLDSHPLAVACGVDSIPFVVLVGKDGNVDSIHVRGEKLAQRLAELLGEPAAAGPKTEDAKPGEEKPAEDKPAEKPAEKTDGDDAPAKEEKEGCGAEEPAQDAAAPAAEEPSEEESKVNPYSAKPGLSAADLVKFIERMLDKPKSIQARPGFAEALCEACDRLIQTDPPAKEGEILLAVETKFETLHKSACSGDAQSDEQLAAFCEQMKADARPRIAAYVSFYTLERKVLEGDKLPPEEIDAVLKELAEFFAKEKLTAKHLRIASSTVALINRLEDGPEREKHFASFGNTFAKSSDKDLARYGKKLAKKPAAAESDLVGKEMELAGTTAAGDQFDWKKYRGKVVLVDFWATWCGPCIRELPNVRETYDRLHDQGLEIVGISLDKDPEALQTFLAEHQLPWETLAGDETQELAEKYSVRGIPTMMVVGKDGKILGVAHQIAALRPIIEKALK